MRELTPLQRISPESPVPQMATVYFITHPDVIIDPAVAVPDWQLSPRGVARMRAMLSQSWVAGIVHVASSTERKATDGAAVLAVRGTYGNA